MVNYFSKDINLKRALTAVLFCSILPVYAYSATGFGGLYQSELSIYRDSDYKWNIPLPKNYFQTKFWSNPLNGVDFYGQFGARTDEPWNNKFNFELERAWGKFWHPKVELILLGKEERHWIDSPLLSLIDTSRVVNNGMAVRYDLKDVYGFKMVGVASKDKPVRHSNGISGQDESEWYGSCFDRDTNLYILRLQKNFYRDTETSSALDIGSNYISRRRFSQEYEVNKDTNGAISGFNGLENIKTANEIISMDARIMLRSASLTCEFARSYSTGTASVASNAGSAFSSELRDIHAGPFWLVGKYFNYGRDFRAETSSRFGKTVFENSGSAEYGRAGYSSEFSYLYPGRVVNIKYARSDYRTKFDHVYNNQLLGDDYYVVFSSAYSRTINDYVEIYAEFIDGIKGRAGYEINSVNEVRRPGIFFEISAEDAFAFGRIQARIKDKNSESGYGERYIMGGELRLNLTDRIQLYWRTVDVQSALLDKNWSSAFYQMRYNIGWDLETYLEYGEGWATDNLAWDTDITDTERSMTHMIKLVFKLNF